MYASQQSESSPSTSKHIIYFDFLRIAAIGAVVFLHLAGENLQTAPVGTFAWNTFNIYDSLVRWGVSIFVMISGALFLNKDRPTKKLYQKNIIKILVILIFWTLFYSLFQPFITKGAWSSDNFWNLLSKGPFHLWFLYTLIGLYMAVPLLRPIVKNKKNTEYFLLLSFIFAFLIPELITIIALKSESVANIIDNKLTTMNLFMVLGFTGYFVLGYYLNKYKITKKTEIIIYILGFLGIIFTIVATIISSNLKNQLDTSFYDNLTVNTAAAGVAVFVFFKKHLNTTKLTSNNRLLQLLSRCSLGVYLIHPFLIIILNSNNINSLSFNPVFSVPVLSFLVFILSYLISIILYKIPFVNKWLI